jgi:hypothetical protein
MGTNNGDGYVVIENYIDPPSNSCKLSVARSYPAAASAGDKIVFAGGVCVLHSSHSDLTTHSLLQC